MPQALKDTKLKNELWYPDSTPDSYLDANPGYSKRKTLAACSQPFTMLGQLVSGIFKVQQLIPPNTVRVILRRNPAEFCLNRPNLKYGAVGEQVDVSYKIEIDEAVFLVARKPVNYKIMERRNKMYEGGETYKYTLNEGAV